MKQKRHWNVEITPELLEIIVKVARQFNGDYTKTKYWLTTENLNLGGLTPLGLIAIGRGHKVLQFVDDAIDK